MNYGPLEFAAYLRRNEQHSESATVEAARSAAPAAPDNTLRFITGARSLAVVARAAQVEAVSVYEAVAMNPPSEPREPGPIHVFVRQTERPVVLVLSSHQSVEWRLEPAAHSSLAAVLLSGYGQSSVMGAGDAVVRRIGGFYAFRRGSAEFRHLESEVLRCTGRVIDHFQSMYAGSRFEIG